MKSIMLLILLGFTFNLNANTTDNKSKEAANIAAELEQKYLKIAEDLATERDEHGACGADIEVYMDKIVKVVREARHYFDQAQFHEANKSRLFTLPNVVKSIMADQLALKEVMNMLDYNDPKSIEKALARVVMYGPAPGAYGNMSKITFGPKNTIVLAELELLDQEPWTQWNTKVGKYSVRLNPNSGNYGTSLFVDLVIDGKLTTYILDKYLNNDQISIYEMWYLLPENSKVKNPYFDGFVNYPSECEA